MLLETIQNDNASCVWSIKNLQYIQYGAALL